MLLSQVYKLRPNTQQSAKMDGWLDMLRSHYNWCLADRINTYHQQFVMGEYSDLRAKAVATPLTCCVVKGGATGEPWKKDGCKRNASLIQDAGLVELKKSRPWYSGIHSNVLQTNIARLNTAYKNFFEGRGFPRFKNRSTFRTFSYKPKDVKIEGSKVYLPSIGWMRFYNSRPIPDGFSIRTVTIRRKQDGWYMSVLIEDKSIPDFPIKPLEEVNTAIGLDMGITKLVHCSDGSQFHNPKFSTDSKTSHLLALRQRRVNRKKKGSKNRAKAGKVVAQLHQRIADKRSDYQWQIANKVVKKADCIVVEDLNISAMKSRCKPRKDEHGNYIKNGQSAKRALNKAISDAAWGDLISKIEYVAAKSGKIFLKINPRHTSQTCSACGCIDKASRDGEKFICTSCGHFDHADLQAASNIKARAAEQFGLVIKQIRRDSPKSPIEPTQLTLWGTPSEFCASTRKRHPAARKSKRQEPGNLIVQLDLFSQDISDIGFASGRILRALAGGLSTITHD